MKSCPECNGAGLNGPRTSIHTRLCRVCKGSGWAYDQQELAGAAADAVAPAPQKPKLLTLDDLREIDKLVLHHKRIAEDQVRLLNCIPSEEIEPSLANKSMVNVVFSVLRVEAKRETMSLLSKPIAAILVQQEVKARRKLRDEYGVHVDAPDNKLYDTMMFAELETMAELMGKPFDEA